MRSKWFVGLCLVSTLALASTGGGQAEQPVAVSPGEASAVSVRLQGCSTFSWGAAVGATRFELVVYELLEEGEQAEEAVPVIQTALPGTAFSWTPSLDQCLEPGGAYVWYIRALDEFDDGEWSEIEEAEFKAPIVDTYDREGHPYHATARMWDDGIIRPRDTRRVLARALSAALNAEIEETRFGVFRM